MFRALKQLATLLHRWTLGWFTRQKPLKKPTSRQQRLHIESLEDRRVFAAGFAEFIDPNPAPGNQFGAQVVPLSTGNVVITSPFDDAGGPDAGAVYLFNGRTGKLITTLTGSHDNDHVGSGVVTPLTNGNFVVLSPDWDREAVVDASAATWVNGTTGLTGVVSANNSLVGSSTGDRLGITSFVVVGVTALANGNFVIVSPLWDNAGTADAGAATFGDGWNGISGELNESNSLVGMNADEEIGSHGVTPLANGNYVVSSAQWAGNSGAVTFGNGTTGVKGFVSEENSLVGSASSGVRALPNGNYVVFSASWNQFAGAVTFGNGTTGVFGPITAENSLIGGSRDDLVSVNVGVRVLANGNYVVGSPAWNNGAGAVTFGSGTTGVHGIVSEANSLIGSAPDDGVGRSVSVLSNGNYVVGSPRWDYNGVADVGAVTFANGTSGISGQVSAANSLIGSKSNDQVGSGFMTPLTNGNYVVSSPLWNNALVTKAGAVTFGNGTNGIVGVVDQSNSLVGTAQDDQVGGNSIVALKNGNYVVISTLWDDGNVLNVGAVTFGDGTQGISGAVSIDNSLIGSTAGDQVGIGTGGSQGVTALTNGNYVVSSPKWDKAAAIDAGAVTWANGLTGISGRVSEANSLVGVMPNDQVGGGGIVSPVTPLTNGNYVIRSSFWDNGTIVDAGAITFGDGNVSLTGTVSESNSLTGGTPDDQIGTSNSLVGVTALANGNYLVNSKNYDSPSVPNAGALSFGDGRFGTSGLVDVANSAVGGATNPDLQAAVLDNVNQNFYARFVAEGGGRVRVGSQIDGFSRPWHLANKPDDVNNDGEVIAEDVITIINYINAGRSVDVAPNAVLGKPFGFLDVTGDGQVTPEDVIEVINYINASHPTEGEAATTSTAPASLPTSTVPTPNLTDSLLLLLATDSSSAKKRK